MAEDVKKEEKPENIGYIDVGEILEGTMALDSFLNDGDPTNMDITNITAMKMLKKFGIDD